LRRTAGQGATAVELEDELEKRGMKIASQAMVDKLVMWGLVRKTQRSDAASKG
jgi:hypothetical protein